MKPAEIAAPAIRIRLLGTVEVEYDGHIVPPFPTHKSKLLFAYLVLHRNRLHLREVLCGLFWGDRPEEVARSRLRTELWRARSTLESAAPSVDWLTVQQNAVGFTPSATCWVDTEAFEQLLDESLHPDVDLYAFETGRCLTDACALYRGDLLEGEYDGWCLDEQRRLNALYVEALEGLVWHHMAYKEWHLAARQARQLLARQPLREDIHRSLLALYYVMGDRARALSQFRECRQSLLQDLGVEPMRSTVRLHEALRREDEKELIDAIASVVPVQGGVTRRPTSQSPRAGPAAEPARALLEVVRCHLGTGPAPGVPDAFDAPVPTERPARSARSRRAGPRRRWDRPQPR